MPAPKKKPTPRRKATPKTEPKAAASEPPAAATSTPDDPQQRAQACARELAEVLGRHRCRIVPFIGEPRSVGEFGQEMILAAKFHIMPVQ